MMNTHKALFYLTRRRLQIYQNQAGRVQVVASFEEGPSQRAECSRFLMQQPASLVQLLVDVSEEDFQSASIPRLGRRDRTRLLQRRLEQLYRTTTYCTAARQGWRDATRHEEDIVFSALSDGNWVDQWVDLLEEYGHVLTGIVSPALLSQRLLRGLSPMHAHQLLLSPAPSGELRQTYAFAGGVKFSRLVSLELHSAQDLPSRLLAESLRAQQYLLSMRLLGRGETLHVLIVAPAVHATLVSQTCIDQESLHFRFLDPVAALQRLGLQSRDEADVHAMFARLGLESCVSDYAPSHRLLTFRRWQVARALQVSGWVVSAAMLCAGLWCYSLLGPLREQQAYVRLQIAPIQQQLLQLRTWERQHNAPRLTADAGLYHRYFQPWPRLDDGLRWLASRLEAHPRIRLQRVAWLFAHEKTADPLAAPTEYKAEVVPASGERQQTAGARYTGFLILGVAGSVDVQGGAYRAALEELEHLRHEVIRGGDRQLIWQSLPLDPRSNSQLNLDSSVMRPEFSARIIVPIVYPVLQASHS